MIKKHVAKILLLLSILSFYGCDPYEHPTLPRELPQEILVYCGMTMSSAVFELSSLFEKETGCKASILYGGSGNLQKVIEVNEQGDIFFPGSYDYVKYLQTKGIVIRTSEVGHNRLSYFVKKGNPLQIDGELSNLTDKHLKVVVGSERAGAIGRATARLLQKHGIKKRVFEESMYVTTDSKGLAESIKEGDADLVINWYATAFFKKNKPFMDPIRIDSPYVKKTRLVMGQLKYSENRNCSDKFLDMVESDRGKEIFRRYGFIE